MCPPLLCSVHKSFIWNCLDRVFEPHQQKKVHQHAGRSPHGFDGKSPGLHYVGEMGDEKGMMRKIFDHATGGKVEWQQMSDVYDRAVFRTQEEQRNMTAEVMWRCRKSVCLACRHSFSRSPFFIERIVTCWDGWKRKRLPGSDRFRW